MSRTLSLLLAFLLGVPAQAQVVVAPAAMNAGSAVGAAGAVGTAGSGAAVSGRLSNPDLSYNPRAVEALPNMQMTTFEMKEAYKAAEKKWIAGVEEVAAIPTGERTFENTVMRLQRVEGEFADEMIAVVHLAGVSPDKRVRRMADAIERRWDKTGLEIGNREDIYKAVQAVAKKGEKLGRLETKLLKDLLEGYRRQGMHLPLRKREEIIRLEKKLTQLDQAFSRNLQDVNETFEFSEEELKGVPVSILEDLERTESGKIKLRLDYPTYGPIMRYAENGAVREKLARAMEDRGGVENVKILEEAVSIRQRMAKLLGYKNHAAYKTENRMAKTPERVMKLVDRVARSLRWAVRDEDQELLAQKREEDPDAKEINPWDRAFYYNKLQRKLFDLDPEEVRGYFPIDRALPGVLGVYEELLGVRFEEREAKGWHPDVKLYEVFDAKTGESLAFIYMDLFPRDGKHDGAYQMSMRKGWDLPDGTYRKPVSAVIANVHKPAPGKPALLSVGDMETLLHELGHGVHSVLTRVRMRAYSGSGVAWDFVETPSQMMENFIWRPEILKRISGHWETGDKIPDELITKLLKVRKWRPATGAMWNAALAMIDMLIHTARGPVDTTQIYFDVVRKLGLKGLIPGTHPQASFTHLFGYDGGYYSYLWSLIFAKDIFSVFEADGVMSRRVGGHYRATILEKGASLDEDKVLREFLGREPSEAAFLESIGVKPGVSVDSKIEPALRKEIEKALIANKELGLKLTGWFDLDFERHDHAGVIVGMRGRGSFRSLAYLHEASSFLWKAKFRWWNPLTWIPRRTGSVADQVRMWLEFASGYINHVEAKLDKLED